MWPQAKSTLRERAPFIVLLPAFAGGIFCYDRFPSDIPHPLIAGCLLIVLLVFAASVYRKPGRRVLLLQWVSAQLFLFMAGWTNMAFTDVRNHPEWAGRHLGTEQYTAVCVAEKPLLRPRVQKVKVEFVACCTRHGQKPVKGYAWLYIYGSEQSCRLYPGDTLLLPPGWKPVKNSGNPFEFGYAAFCRRNNIGYQCFIQPDSLIVHGRAGSRLRPLPERMHDWCNRQLEAFIKDTATLGLLQSMITGDETFLDPGLQQAYADTGIVHIISISGSHVAVLFMTLTTLLGFIRQKRHRWIKYAIGISGVWLYVLMSGAAPSAVRSALMFSIPAIGAMSGRTSLPLNQLLAAAFILLLAEPAWLFSIGFQFSFLAILSLLVFYQPLNALYTGRSKWIGKLWSVLAASLAAEILMAPVVACYFHSFPPLFLLANVLCFLAANVLLLSGMLIILLAPLKLPAAFLAALTVVLMRCFNLCIGFLQQLSPHSCFTLRATVWETVFLYVFIGGIAVFLFRKKTSALLAAMAGIVCWSAVGLWYDWHQSRQQRLVIYNDRKAGRVEWIAGNRFAVLHPLNDTAETYASRAAHIGYQALHRSAAPATPCHQVGERKILVWNTASGLYAGDTFSVHTLVVTGKLDNADPGLLYSVFRPLQLVVSGQQSSYRINAWRAFCAQRHLAFHYTTEDGAFIIE